MVTIGLLGPMRAEVDGEPVELGGPRQRAVLARLACAGGLVVGVDRLVDDLWHNDPPAKAQAALQVYVSNLRRVLEPARKPRTPASVVVSATPGYALRLPAERVDTWRVERLIRDAVADVSTDPAGTLRRLDEALADWVGPAYAEFADEPWAAGESRRLGELRAVAIEQRARAGLALGRADAVVPDLDRHVRDNPLREQAVQLLAVALYRTSRQADALAALRRLREELAEQLGVDPSPATRQLEADLLRQDPALAGPVIAPPLPVEPEAAPAPNQPVGRSAELARLRAAADQARTGGPYLCWVTGEAGSGKSTLARMLADELAGEGWLTASGRCPEVDGAPPAWAWGEVLRELGRRVPLPPERAQVLAPLLAEQPVGPPPGGHFWLHRAAGDYFAEAAGEAPLLLVLDDVHRADGETLRLLRHLAVAVERRPVLVVATYRPGEAGDYLEATRAALASVASVDLALAGLDENAVGELLRRHGDDAAPDVVRAVWRRTSGNPLFVAEIGRLLAAEGSPQALAGIPAGIRHVLGRRLRRLPATAQTVLRQAAVVGRDVDVDVLLDIAGAGEEQVLDGLEAGVLAGLLVEPEPGRVRYDDTPLLRRGRLHARTLAALERHRPDDIAGLGRHALAALTPENAGRAVGYAAAAAQQAAAMDAPREAAALFGGALGALDLVPDADDHRRLTLLQGLASAHAHAGDVLSARRIRAEAVAIAERTGRLPARCAALTCFDAPVTWTIRPDRQVDGQLVAALDAALAQVGPDQPALRALLLSTLVFELEGADDARTDAASREALELARPLGEPQVLCMALNARYFVTLTPHRRAELGEVGAELRDVSGAAGLTAYSAEAHHILYQDATGQHDFDQARWHVERAVEQATTGQLGLILAVMGWFEALLALFAGDLALAERRYDALARRMELLGGPNGAAMGVLGRVSVRLAAGRLTEENVAELTQIHQRVPDDVHDLLTRALLDVGREEQARRVWRPEVPVKADYFWKLWTAIRGQNAVRLHDAEVGEACYQALLPWQDSFAGLENGSVSLGPVHDTLAELAELLGDPAAAKRHHAAGRALARRVGARPWLD